MKRIFEWIKAKLNIRSVVRCAFDKKFKKRKVYHAVRPFLGQFPRDKIITWYEIFGIKLFEKTVFTYLTPEHVNCRCQIIKV
jgi:hypothetical protein